LITTTRLQSTGMRRFAGPDASDDGRQAGPPLGQSCAFGRDLGGGGSSSRLAASSAGAIRAL
jgi:hypothetical protein